MLSTYGQFRFRPNLLSSPLLSPHLPLSKLALGDDPTILHYFLDKI